MATSADSLPRVDELDLQAAVQAALAIIDRDDESALRLEIASDVNAAAVRMRCFADAIVKLGGGSIVRPRTKTLKQPPLIPPKK